MYMLDINPTHGVNVLHIVGSLYSLNTSSFNPCERQELAIEDCPFYTFPYQHISDISYSSILAHVYIYQYQCLDMYIYALAYSLTILMDVSCKSPYITIHHYNTI